jgi:Protein of unknown function (DUF2631)
VAEDEPVTAPDQHRPTNRKAAYTGGIITALILLAMQFGNNDPGWVDRLWLIGGAAIILAIIIGDVVLRRNGLRS